MPTHRTIPTEAEAIRAWHSCCSASGVGACAANVGRSSGATRLRRGTFNDYQQITQLEARFGLGVRSYDDWSHLWLENPAYRALESDWDIGWVVEDQDRRIVASLANIPLAYEFQGRQILATTGKALVAEPVYRSACLLLLDQLINRTRADLYLNNTVGASSVGSVELFGIPRVPAGVWDQAAFWVTGYSGFFESYLTFKKFKQPKLLSYPLGAAAFLRDSARCKGIRAGDVEVIACDGFDQRFDEFWEALRRKHQYLLLAVRSRETLAWHFKHAALENRLWIAAVADGPRLAAYAIFERKDTGGPYTGLKRVRLVDFQALDGTTMLLSPLLAWALKRCRRQSIHLFEIVGRWLEPGAVVHSLAPYHRKLPAWTYYYNSRNAGLAHSLKDPRAWAPSLFDGDATL